MAPPPAGALLRRIGACLASHHFEVDTTLDLVSHVEDLDRLIKSYPAGSESLKYKAANRPLQERDYKEVAKDISAFAKSAGGLLI